MFNSFVVLLIILFPVVLSSQASPNLQWDQAAPTVAAASGYSYELWINGTGQLPLRKANCVGAASPFICTDLAGIPNQPEGIRNFQLLAVTPQGIKSVLSSNFPVTYPSAPTNLRLN